MRRGEAAGLFSEKTRDEEFARTVGLSSDEIERLHDKSRQQGIAPDLSHVRFRLHGPMLDRLMARNRTVLDVAGEWISSSPRRFFFPHLLVITDAYGVVLRVSGDPESLEKSERTLKIGVGASLSISSAGTNAVSASIELRRSALVLGNDHYLDAMKDWLTLCVPVRNADGRAVALVAICASRSISALLVFAGLCSLAEIIESNYQRAEANGKIWFSETELKDRLNQFELSPREREIAFYWLLDYDCRRIGQALDLSENTVRVYISRIHNKLNVNSKASFILRVLKGV